MHFSHQFCLNRVDFLLNNAAQAFLQAVVEPVLFPGMKDMESWLDYVFKDLPISDFEIE